MDINRLNEFIVLATHLNYSKAANQLFLTQPALSRHIHDLEQTLGAQLFIRDTHNVYLTSVGQLFFNEAKAIVERYNSAIDLVKEASQNTTGKLKIGFLGAAVQPFLAGFTGEFTHQFPQIKLEFECNDQHQLAKSLNNDDIDICFVTHIDSSYFPGLQSETILKDPLYVIMSPQHPLSNCEVLSLKDITEMPFIGFEQTSNPIANDFHKQLFKKANAQYNIVQEVSNIETAMFFVSIDKGAFIIPKHLTFMANGLVTIPLSDKYCKISLNMLWKKSNPNPAIATFQKEFARFIKNMDL